MKLLLILILIGLVVMIALRNKAPKETGIAIYLLLGLFVIVQGMVIFRSCSDTGPTFIPSFHEVAGRTLGEYLAKQYPGGGDVLVLLGGTEDPLNPGPSEKDLAHASGLRAGFAGSGLNLVEYVIEPPEPGMNMIAAGPVLTARQFYAILVQEPVVAAVTGIGVPPLVMKPPANAPPIYVLEAVHEHDGRRLMEDGVVQGGVLIRAGADWSRKPGLRTTEDELFTMRYILATPDDGGV